MIFRFNQQGKDVKPKCVGSFSVWSSFLWDVHDRIFFFLSLSVCVGGWWLCTLIEICDSSSGYGGPLDECPWAPGLLSSFFGAWLSLGLVSNAGPCLVHYLWLSIWRQVPPPVLFSPLQWMSVECEAKDNSFWKKNTGLPHFALTSWWQTLRSLSCRRRMLLFPTNARILWHRVAFIWL